MYYLLYHKTNLPICAKQRRLMQLIINGPFTSCLQTPAKCNTCQISFHAEKLGCNTLETILGSLFCILLVSVWNSEPNFSQLGGVVLVVHMNSWIWYYVAKGMFKQTEGFASVSLWNQFRISLGIFLVLASISIFWGTVSHGHLGEELPLS